MKAFLVDDSCYWIFTVELEDGYDFEGQYRYFPNFLDARDELTKIIRADLEEMKASLRELAQLKESEVVAK